MADKHLSVVSPDSAPASAPPTNISEAVDLTARDLLVQMRKALARKLDADEIASNSIAAAYTKLQELDRLIRAGDAEAAAEEAKRDAESSRTRRSFDSSAI